MRISQIKIQNFKSFGQNITTIDFKDDGELILLQGSNAQGKSAIQESIDLSIFRQVRGKNKTKIPHTVLPNRTNKNLFTQASFYNYKNDFIVSSVKLEPKEFKITKNDIDITESFKKMSEDDKEKIIGFNYKTFKSFVSLSVNDFLNFMTLTGEDKKNLLDKLFNLEELSEYINIIKDIIKNNNTYINDIKNKIIDNNEKIKTLKDTIQQLQNTNDLNKNVKIDELNNTFEDKKKSYHQVKLKKQKLDGEYSDTETKIDRIKGLLKLNESNIVKKRLELQNIKQKINTFESGVCYVCNTDLKDELHLKHLQELRSEYDIFSGEINNIKDEDIKYNDEISTLKFISSNINKDKNNVESQRQELLSELKILQYQIQQLSSIDKDQNFEDVIKRLKLDGSVFVKENKDYFQKIIQFENNNETYNQLFQVMGEYGGIRSEIIEKIVKPINQCLNEFLSEIDFPYRVELNNEFNAVIYEKEINEIYSETLSNGESKIINILIALSYLKIIRQVKNINVLFLDEVFNSIALENVDLILKILKKFSQEYNLNILIIHHGVESISTKYFDRIIKVSKKYFTEIEDERISL